MKNKMLKPVASDANNFQSVSLTNAKELMLQIFMAQRELKKIYTDYSWRGLGNTLGDYGELIAILEYGLQKADKGSKGFDALFQGQKVQIKTIMHSKQIGIRGKGKEAEMILVIKINEDDASWKEIFWGNYEDFISVGATFSARDNKSMMSVNKLQKYNLTKAMIK